MSSNFVLFLNRGLSQLHVSFKNVVFLFYSESEAALRGRSSSHGSSANVSDDGNPYESVDKVKVKPNEEAGTSDLPSMPPVNAAVDKVAQKKEREAVSHFELHFESCRICMVNRWLGWWVGG